MRHRRICGFFFAYQHLGAGENLTVYTCPVNLYWNMIPPDQYWFYIQFLSEKKTEEAARDVIPRDSLWLVTELSIGAI